MERVGIRQLRNYASRVVRRAQAGQRIVITVDGVPAAQIGPRFVAVPIDGRCLADAVAIGARTRFARWMPSISLRRPSAQTIYLPDLRPTPGRCRSGPWSRGDRR
ncbi:MAG: type II toxin-antitoxin system prevent-host-death family antitoxin [Chloroflexota bacterium]|nr:type II toxin-antitoxin system prevent-host-death family antitoxin [Chloroflexota bacterium]